MATILLAWELGAGTGHCVNLLPLAEGLIAIGHRVILAGRDLVAAKRVFGATNVEFVQAPFLIGTWSKHIEKPQSFAQILHNTGFGDDEHLQVLTNAWGSLLKAFDPKLVLCEHAPHALLAARRHDVARIVLGTGFFVPPAISPFPIFEASDEGSDNDNALAKTVIDCESAILDRVNKYLASAGKQKIAILSKLYSQVDHQFLLTLPELDHYQGRALNGIDARATYIRPWTPPGGIRPMWPAETGPKVFAYLQPGSRYWRLTEVLALLAEMQAPTVAHIPNGNETLVNRYRNSSVSIVTERVDIAAVAQQADLAILNGNAGTATELLLAGLPQLNIPLHLEQAIFSHRVSQLGAGLQARPDQLAQIAARTMALVTGSDCREKAQSVGESYSKQPLPGQDMIYSAVEKLL